MLEVAQRKGTGGIVPAQLAGIEDVPVLLAEERQQDLAAQLLAQRFPVDVEIVGVVRLFAPGEQVEPPRVVAAAHAHVIGDEVEDVPHPVRAQGGDEGLVVGGAAQFGVERAVVNDVVPVLRAGARSQVGRRVDVGDPEPSEIRHQRGRGGEPESGLELQPVGSTRRHEVRNQPALQRGRTPFSSSAATSPCAKSGRPSTR